MADALALRTWATPLTIGSFILMTATGVLMFFEWDEGLTTVVHQWCSWIFVTGAAGHVVANVRPFKRHLASRIGKASVATFLALAVAAYFSWGIVTGPQLVRPIERALVEAPLSALASLTRTDPRALLGRLQAHGIVATGEQSIHHLARRSGVSENRLLAIVFLSE